GADSPAATAVEAAPPERLRPARDAAAAHPAKEAAPPAPKETPTPAPAHGEDVASFDEETNAKYEQVKGGKLYIKDLQKMDVHQLHEIAKQEGIPDYVGLKKQDL